jgi:hypothetical protein
MILASDVFADVKSFLDDDSSGRYQEQTDLVPAINNAILYLVAVFNAAFEAKKISPESLRDLSITKILPVTGTTTKKCDLSTITDLWTVFGVEADPSIMGSGLSATLSESRNKFATRMTLENWNDALADPFSAGTGVSIPSEFVRPGYLGPGQYLGDGKPYIMIRPAVAFTADYVAIWYLRNPTKIATGATSVEFPRSLHGLLVQKTINYMAMQHEGAGGYKSASDTKYRAITEQEIKTLVSLMLS